MRTDLLERPLVPVAGPDDAAATYEELRPYLLDTDSVPVLVHVVEKGGGAPDKMSVEQANEHAENTFRTFRNRAEVDGIDVKTVVSYGTDVAETIHDAAAEHDATAIVFRSRGSSRWIDLVTGNVRANLISNHELPVIVLPEVEADAQ